MSAGDMPAFVSSVGGVPPTYNHSNSDFGNNSNSVANHPFHLNRQQYQWQSSQMDYQITASGAITTTGNNNIPAGSSNKSHQCRDELALPDDFEPSPYSVVCGRGRKASDAVGNRRLGVIASMHVKRYSDAQKKEEKSKIVTEILEIVRSACPSSSHAFVRYSNGQWWRVQNLHAREKIGTVLRDCLHSKYKSSTKSKLAKRKQRKTKQKSDPEEAKQECNSAQPDPSASNGLLVPTAVIHPKDELKVDDFDTLFE